jgi:hypothetical protein
LWPGSGKGALSCGFLAVPFAGVKNSWISEHGKMIKSNKLYHLFKFLKQYRHALVHLAVLFFLIAGFAYSLYLGDVIRFPDEKQYYNIARNLAAGNGYSINGIDPTAIRPPIYPLFMAFFIKLGAPIFILRFLNFIALALCVYVIRSILRHEKAQCGAGLSAILLSGYGVLFYTAGTLYTQTFYTLILLVIIRLAVVNDFGWLQAVFLGLLSALLIMVHPTGVFIPPLVVIWLFFPRNYHIIKKGIAAALVAVACISIWSYRNYKVFDRFIPITSHGGDTLYIGNNPHTSLTGWYNYIYDDYYIEANKLPETEQNSFYLHKTKQFWTEHTGAALKLYFVKLLDYFNFRNNLYLSSEFDILRSAIMFVTYYPLLICLVLRLLFIGKIPLSKTEALLVAIYLVSALFHAVFLPRIRFRLPYDAMLIAHIGIMFSLLRRNVQAALPGKS